MDFLCSWSSRAGIFLSVSRYRSRYVVIVLESLVDFFLSVVTDLDKCIVFSQDIFEMTGEVSDYYHMCTLEVPT